MVSWVRVFVYVLSSRFFSGGLEDSVVGVNYK